MPAFKTGARPSPRHKLLAAMPYRMVAAPPPQFAYIPAKLDMWGNDQYGDCVSAEEAFAKACFMPEIFVPAQTVIAWADAGGFLNGADLTSVMDAMAHKGFTVGSTTYGDGPYQSVDYSNEQILQAALSNIQALGPVKIGIDSSALPSGAGNQQGWHAFGGRPGQYHNEDHCVALCGYGPVAWLAQKLNVAVPAGAPANGYLLYTWSTIGIVDHDWIMSTCGEAWLRTPTTTGATPQPPDPPNPPVPTPSPFQLWVDGIFDSLAAAHPFFAPFILKVKALVDAWIFQHAARCASAPRGSWANIVDAIFADIAAGLQGHVLALMALNAVKQMVDQWMQAHGW